MSSEPDDERFSEEEQRRALEAKAASYFRRRYLIWGVLIFAGISGLGIAASFLWSAGGAIWPTVRSMRPALLALLAGLVLADWSLGAYRLHLFAHPLTNRVRFLDCFRANLANMFMGGITPTQSGGGPAQLYILWRAGLPVSSGIAFTVINFVSTLVALLLAVGFVLVATPAEFPPTMRFAIRSGFVACSAILALLVLTLLSPRSIGELLLRWLDRLGAPAGSLGSRQARFWRGKLQLLLRDWHAAIHLVSRRKPHLLLLSQLVTILLYFNKCLIGYVLARAMGIRAPFWSVLGAQALLIFICYFAPTPGGSFIAEVANTFLMGFVSGREKMAAYTTLARISTTWLAVALGGVILAQQIRKDAGRLFHPGPESGSAEMPAAGAPADAPTKT